MLVTHSDFHELYVENYTFVWHSLRRLGVPQLVLDDAVQDTFITAYRRRDTFDGRSPRAWLYSIGRGVANNARRARSRRARRHTEAPPPLGLQGPNEEQLSARRTIAGFLATLDDADRELFVLCEVDGLTGPELAAALGRKLPTLYGRIRVLRDRFRAFAGEELNPAHRARTGPRGAASAGWVALQPWLQASAATASLGVAGAGTISTLGWFSGGAAAALVSGAVLWGVADTSAPPPSRPVEVAASGSDVSLAPRRPLASVPRPTPVLAPTLSAPIGPAPVSSRRKPRLRSREPEKPQVPPNLALETERLRLVRESLRAGKAEDALRLLADLRARVPNSGQQDLRVALEVEALCALDRLDDARSVAARLRAANPGSPVHLRISKTCAGVSALP